MLARLPPAAARFATSVALGSALAAALLPFARRLPNVLVPDDGYFYAQIAYNLALHGRSTFDGVHATNGYHLPWALVLAAASRIIAVFSHDKAVHLFGHLAIALSLAVATVRHYFARPLVRACAFVVLVSSFSLTEMILAAPILLALLRRLNDEEPGAARRAGAAELLAVVLALVRVDLAAAPIAAAAFLARSDPRRAARLAGAALAGVVLELEMTKAVSGHFVSVAAWIKAGVTHYDVPALLRLNLAPSAFVALTFGAHAMLAAIAVALRPKRVTATLLAASLAFLAFHTCFNVLRGWYWVPSWLGLLFTVEQAMTRASPLDPRARAARAGMGLVTFAFVLHAVRAEILYAADQRASASFLARLPELVPRGARIFTFDNPGFLGFFSGYDVVDGDGLVNDFGFARRLMSDRLAGYLDEERLCHVVVADADARPVLDLAGLVLGAEDVVPLLVVRRHVESQADFALYRLTAARCAP